ncbi:MAG: hypothetical protein ACLQOO_14460 [Terriglobia bacterium]
MLKYTELILSAANIAVAGALALFAYRTWQSTKLYSRATALSILAEQFHLVIGPSDNSPNQEEVKWARSTFVAIFENFPELRPYFDPQIPNVVRERFRQ